MLAAALSPTGSDSDTDTGGWEMRGMVTPGLRGGDVGREACDGDSEEAGCVLRAGSMEGLVKSGNEMSRLAPGGMADSCLAAGAAGGDRGARASGILWPLWGELS